MLFDKVPAGRPLGLRPSVSRHVRIRRWQVGSLGPWTHTSETCQGRVKALVGNQWRDAHVDDVPSGGQGIDKLPGQLDQSPGPLLANPPFRAKSSPIVHADSGVFGGQEEDDTGGNVVLVERQGKEPTLVLQVRFYARVVGGLVRAGDD